MDSVEVGGSSILSVEVSELQQQIYQLHKDLEEARSEVMIAKCTAENEVAIERRKCQEEIATVQQLLGEDVANANSEIELLKVSMEKLEFEKHHYRSLYEQKLEDSDLRHKGDGLLNPNVLSVVTKSIVKRVPSLSPAHSTERTSTTSPVVDQSISSLEDSMKKAQEDAAMLKSLVEPLEEEISALKTKIREQDVQLRAHEIHQQADITTSSVLGPLLKGREASDLVRELDEKLKSISSYMEDESPSRGEMELYSAILNSQKAALMADVDKLHSQLTELRQDFESEKQKNRSLKSTWQRANDDFLITQKHQLENLQQIYSILTPDQSRIIQEMHSQDSILGQKWSDGESLTEATEPDESVEPKTGSRLQGASDAEVAEHIVSKKEWNHLQQQLKKIQACMPQTCQCCSHLQDQLKELQTAMRDKEKDCSTIERAFRRQQDELSRETQYRIEVEAKWLEQAGEFEHREAELRNYIDKLAKQYGDIVKRIQGTEKVLNIKLESLTDGRDAIQKEINRLQAENDLLVGKHSKHSQALQDEIINLPDSMEEMQLFLLRNQEELIRAKVAKEHIESASAAKIQHLQEQLRDLQNSKVEQESSFTAQLSHLSNRVATTKHLENKLKEVCHEREELEGKLQDMETKIQETERKSSQIIAALKEQVIEYKEEKMRKETLAMELKGRVSSLQKDLDTTETVQRDFVRLSQSLQVQLEKIRQSEKEVRWQHEEDIDDCNNCKQKFSSVGRRKHHCRHCGKIYCAECSSKTVPSGPNGRLSRVCDVCHTLLVQDATPYFSTEPPQTPD